MGSQSFDSSMRSKLYHFTTQISLCSTGNFIYNTQMPIIIAYTISIVFFFFIILWVTAFYLSNEFKVPTLTKFEFKKVLVVFPHPDDEVLTVGGFTQKLASQNIDTTLRVLSRGEKGTPDATLNTKLGEIRAKEMINVAELLDIQEVLIDTYPDGELRQHSPSVRDRIKEIMDSVQPDLVITYDTSGMYGHDDHIAVSEIITDLLEKNDKDTTLWYASLPSKVYSRLGLPTYMAKDSSFASRRMVPTHKVWVGLNIINKVNAVYAHKSQYLSFRNSIPIKWIPIWFFLSTGLYEYFHEVEN